MKTPAILLTICCILLTSCTDESSYYSDQSRLEQIVIHDFMEERGFTILNDYPRDGVFGEKEFALLPNGVYLHVIDPGNGNLAVRGTEVSSLAKGQVVDLRDPTTYFDGFQPEDKSTLCTVPFTYGVTSFATDYNHNVLVGDGYMGIMRYVGDNASVSMIIPCSVGCWYQQSNMVPIYFEKVTYTFVK